MSFIKKICLLLIILLSFSFSYSQSLFKLEVEIKGLKNNSGRIMLQLLDEKNKIISQKMGMINSRSSDIIINNLKPGKYAIRFYHDENLDGHLDSNFIGKPTEGYGYSNNVKSSYGEPPLKDIIFSLSSDKKLVLQPNY